MTYNESPYIKALTDLNSDNFEEKEWLCKHFELFKTTLVWPNHLPPIDMSQMEVGTIRQKFNATYREILNGYKHSFEQETKSLKFS